MRATSEIDTLSRRMAFLRRVPLFGDLAEDNLRILINDFRRRVYERDAIIFRQEDTSHELYLVAEGKVRVYKLSPAGNETSLNIFSTGDIIGEFAALDRQPRSATAQAIEDCVLLEMTSDCLMQRMHEIPDLAINLARLVASKVRWTTEYAETIAQCDAAGRLLQILLMYNLRFGQVVEPGQRYELNLSLNQADLASLIGVRREWVNHILRRWRRQGLIEYKAGQILILDLSRVVQERDRRLAACRGQATW
jgi:CRP/FNR family cyclic AMP-dependent transcriptional regulator